MMKKLLLSLLGLTLLIPPPVAQAQMVNAQTATTYTVLNTDCDPSARRLVTFNNSAGVAVTLPQAGVNGTFSNGCVMNFLNIAPTGTVTITPTTSTINGQASLTLQPGGSAMITNDSSGAGTGNYWTTQQGGGAAAGSFTNFRNVLDNGAAQVVQRALGTAATTCGTTTGSTSLTYSADRWTCVVNVGSQQGRTQVVTTGPTPPTGFTKSINVWRNSAALTQPVCLMQEVPTSDSTTLAGQVATFSFYGQALAGLAADNGGVVNGYIFTGTGSDQGLGTMTASPAVTPAWTNIAATTTKAFTLSSSTWNRYSVSGLIPAATTEVGVAICFTPTATGAGATDGFSATGMQLEAASAPTPYEFRPASVELTKNQAYFFQIPDPAATVYIPSVCSVTAANTTVKCALTLPVTMRTTPTTTVLTATSFGIQVTAGTAGTCSTLAATASASTPTSAGVTCTTAGTIALGSATPLIGAAVSNATISVSADF